MSDVTRRMLEWIPTIAKQSDFNSVPILTAIYEDKSWTKRVIRFVVCYKRRFVDLPTSHVDWLLWRLSVFSLGAQIPKSISSVLAEMDVFTWFTYCSYCNTLASWAGRLLRLRQLNTWTARGTSRIAAATTRCMENFKRPWCRLIRAAF